MRPSTESTCEESVTAWAKSPVRCVMAVRNRLPKLWPFRPRPRVEAVLKQARDQTLVFRQRHHAIADVAGREHVEFAAQAAGTAAIVGDRDDRRELQRAFGGLHVALQPPQQRGKAGAAADRDDS